MREIGKTSRRVLTAVLLATLGGVFTESQRPATAGPAARARAASPAGEPAAEPTLERPAAPEGVRSLMLELEEPAAAVAYGGAIARRAGRSEAALAARAQKARNEAAQEETLRSLRAAVPAATLLYRVQSAYNGIAVRADVRQIEALRALPNVKAVHPIQPMKRHNASAVPLTGAPSAWQSLGLTGTGIRVGVIDTGIDYVHTNFGGSGTQADLDAARAAAANPSTPGAPHVPGFTVTGSSGQVFPSAKVAGGFDFAGDSYNGGNAPAPDPNPMDCPSSLGGGHGSHVAGTAAGYGVNADGTTFGGPWNSSTPFDTMRIGPGVAPGAQLYALRVFGCSGSTDLVTQAIDWALDPDGDGNLGDHLDVINMSLGSDFGTTDNPDSVAANNAAAAGVAVVISAGNDGDVTYVTGSPGTATRALSVASSVDGTDVVDGFGVNSPPAYAGTQPASASVAYDWQNKPDVTGNLYYPATNQTGCSAWTGADLAAISGKVVLVDWRTGTSTTFPCGSVTRSANAVAAGAVGIIMADNVPYFETAITGSTVIPAVYTPKTVGDTLKTALGSGGVNVTFSKTFLAATKFVTPERVDQISSFTSRGPQVGRNQLKPEISAPGQGIFSTAAGTGSQGESLNGTSMAAPHVAGVLALLRQKNPGWSVEEIKALAMNYARHDLTTGPSQTGTKYAPARVGAGRVDAADSIAASVVACSADDLGAVGVAFGPLEILGTQTFDRTIRVTNKGGAPVAYSLSVDARTSVPGVSLSFPDGASVSVGANASATFRLRLTADASQMKNPRDGTMDANQNGEPRHTLAEASGLVVLTPTSGATLAARVPYHASARPASSMAASPAVLAFPSDTGSSLTLTLGGTGVNTGTSFPTDLRSLVTPFELALASPQQTLGAGVPESARDADLRYVGVASRRIDAGNPSRVDNSTIYFGLATWGDRSAPVSEAGFEVLIDVDRNGSDDYLLYPARYTGTDVFPVVLRKLSDSSEQVVGRVNVKDASVPTAIFDTNLLVLPLPAAALGMGPATRFDYRVRATNLVWGVVETTAKLTYDYAAPGLDFVAATVGDPLHDDLPGGTLPVAYDGPSFRANGSVGALLFHFFNAAPARTQVIGVACTPYTVNAPAVVTGTIGAAYSQAVTQTGGVAPVTYTTASPLPGGMSLATDGTLSGTPTQAGSFPITVSTTDATGCPGSVTFTLTIACSTVTLSPDTLPTPQVGTAYSQTITAAGAGSSTFSVTAGTLPGGLALSPSGTLSGTPNGSGTFGFTVQATDSQGCVGSKVYSVTIAPAPAITSIVPPVGPPAGGQVVTITGLDLAGATAVTFGGAAAQIIAATPTQLTVVSPAHPGGSVDVVVTAPGGPATLRAAYAYMATDVPALSTGMLLAFAAALAGAALFRMRW